MSDDFQIYAVGLMHCSVCTSLTDKDEIRKRVNEEVPTGIRSDWDFAEDETFRGGLPNPGPCERHPKNTHYLMVC